MRSQNEHTKSYVTRLTLPRKRACRAVKHPLTTQIRLLSLDFVLARARRCLITKAHTFAVVCVDTTSFLKLYPAMFFGDKLNVVREPEAGKYYVIQKDSVGYVEIPGPFQKFAEQKLVGLSNSVSTKMTALTVVQSLVCVHKALETRDGAQVQRIHEKFEKRVNLAPPFPEFPQVVANDPHLKHELQKVALKLGLDYLNDYMGLATGFD
uniref:NmrA domain-containing protein n=1 Tax=Panagrellus redivivus TaxID=6233 RepID=A0A7E4VAK6_PANRE